MKEVFPVIIVTGLSGSGKSTALNVFEDLGFYAVDGLPASLTPQMTSLFLQATSAQYKGLVLGMDLRQSAFITDYQEAIDELKGKGFSPSLVFLEARSDVLIKRYATTRRPHPLEKEGIGLDKALSLERERMSELRNRADLIVDTSNFSIHDLRRSLQEKWQFFGKSARALRVHLMTFGFKYGTPSEADIVIDLRFLPNPYFIEDLRPLSGKDKPVSDYVLQQPACVAFFEKWQELLLFMLEENEKEGRFRLTVALGCTGGHHRSVAVAEKTAARLKEKGYTVTLEHRHLELG